MLSLKENNYNHYHPEIAEHRQEKYISIPETAVSSSWHLAESI